ncbi:MAG: glycosyltransferase family 2 protein, partial [Gammaproteobacteria bacterium]|nr:glycosyltransferase family 2 protein [Gammaproteobacteria bacterium]
RRAYEVFNGILVVPGAIGAWRTKAVIESGYVSGDTITEDADLTVAVHRADYKVMYAPQAKSYTEVPNSVASFMRQRLRWSLGMLQIAWKHKRSIREGHAVGFISIVDLVWYRVVSSFIYPLVDLILISTLFSWGHSFATRGAIEVGDFSVKIILLFALLTLLDVINLAAAFWFERKFEGKLLFLVPLLRFGYRQLLYISSLRSIYHAVSGRLSGWQKLVRTDTARMRD